MKKPDSVLNYQIRPLRLNEGNVERHTLDRLASFVDLVTGARITYEQLKGGKTWFDAEESNATV